MRRYYWATHKLLNAGNLQNKAYSREWLWPGRVRVQLKSDSGAYINSQVTCRTCLVGKHRFAQQRNAALIPAPLLSQSVVMKVNNAALCRKESSFGHRRCSAQAAESAEQAQAGSQAFHVCEPTVQGSLHRKKGKSQAVMSGFWGWIKDAESNGLVAPFFIKMR